MFHHDDARLVLWGGGAYLFSIFHKTHSKTLVLKVTPLVLIEDHTEWVLNFNTKMITPNTSLVLFQHSWW